MKNPKESKNILFYTIKLLQLKPKKNVSKLNAKFLTCTCIRIKDLINKKKRKKCQNVKDELPEKYIEENSRLNKRLHEHKRGYFSKVTKKAVFVHCNETGYKT